MKYKSIVLFVLFPLILPVGSFNAFAKDTPFTQEDRDRIIKVEAKLEIVFQQIDKRFEQVDKRFEQVDKRFEQVDKRFEEIITFLWIITSVFTAITISTIGFAVWDRRSMIRPFESRMKELEEGKIDKIVSSLKELAKKDIKVAEVLKKFNLF